jgi:hypothetical protein
VTVFNKNFLHRAVARDVHYGDKSCYFNTSFPVEDGQVNKNIFNKINLNSVFLSMGVSRLFSRGGQKFSREARTYFLPKKQRKRYYFFPKKSKNIQFLAGLGRPGGRGQEPPLPSPADAHVSFINSYIHLFIILVQPKHISIKKSMIETN